MIRSFLIVLALMVCLASQSCADVGTARQYRLQRQQQQQQVQQEIPYPAAGYRPGRQFFLPQEQQQQPAQFDETNFADAQSQSQPRRPDLIYGAPNQAPTAPQLPSQSARLVQEQQFFLAPQRLNNAAPVFGSRRKSQRLSAASNLKKSGRLVDNSENLAEDDEDEIETDIDVKTENVPRTAGQNPAPFPSPVPVPVPVPTSPQPTTVYYPAGAVSFVQPLSGATYLQQQPMQVQAQPVNAPATPNAAAAAAAYIQALQYSNYPVQSVAAPLDAAPVTVAAPAQPLQGQTISSAKQTAQPAAGAVAVSAPFYPSPAALTATPSFYSSPTAAYTAAFAQPQYYATTQAQLTAAPIMTPAQLQVW